MKKQKSRLVARGISEVGKKGLFDLLMIPPRNKSIFKKSSNTLPG
jgi:hypothetical protein